jgi:hypothetical protein
MIEKVWYYSGQQVAEKKRRRKEEKKKKEEKKRRKKKKKKKTDGQMARFEPACLRIFFFLRVQPHSHLRWKGLYEW